MQTSKPQNPIGKTIAALVGVLAIALVVAWQDVTATHVMDDDATMSDEVPAAGLGYFPAQFQMRHGADDAMDLFSPF